MNNAPEWAKGTFIWKLCLADRPDSLLEALETIAALADRLVEHAHPPIRYCWGHGGLAANDYSRIGSGYGMGAMAKRGGKAMQVYGNQGQYHLQGGSTVPEALGSGRK